MKRPKREKSGLALTRGLLKNRKLQLDTKVLMCWVMFLVHRRKVIYFREG